MKLWMIIVVGVTVTIVAAGAVTIWWWMSKPLYTPGTIAARADLNAPLQTTLGERWQVTNDIALHHFAVGEGRNVVIIHGGPGIPTSAPYPGLVGLYDQYRFHYYDQRGCGKSVRPVGDSWSANTYENIRRLEGTLGIGAQLSDIERIRRILGDDRIIIIGHSYGALLSALYATEFPDHVAALVLISPADLLTLPSTSGGLFETMRERLPENDREPFDKWLNRYLDLGSVFEKSEEDLVGEDMDFAHFYQVASHSRSPQQPESAQIGAWMIRAQYFSLGKRHDYRDALGAITAPVLVVRGADDIQPVAVARSYSDALPNAEIRIIEGAGHFPQVERPGEFLATVSAFFDSVK